MVASTFQKRGLLRDFKRQADAKSITLLEALLLILSAPVVTVQKGRILISASSGEVTASFSTSIGLSQAQLMDVVSELIDRYEQAKADLISEGNATPTDAQIYARELDDLRAIKGYTSNFLWLTK